MLKRSVLRRSGVRGRSRRTRGVRPQRKSRRPGQKPTRPGHELRRPGQKPPRPGHELRRPGQKPARPGHELRRPGQKPARPGQKPARPGHEVTRARPQSPVAAEVFGEHRSVVPHEHDGQGSIAKTAREPSRSGRLQGSALDEVNHARPQSPVAAEVFGEHRSGAYFEYVSTGAQSKRRPRRGSAGVLTSAPTLPRKRAVLLPVFVA